MSLSSGFLKAIEEQKKNNNVKRSTSVQTKGEYAEQTKRKNEAVVKRLQNDPILNANKMPEPLQRINDERNARMLMSSIMAQEQKTPLSYREKTTLVDNRLKEVETAISANLAKYETLRNKYFPEKKSGAPAGFYVNRIPEYEIIETLSGKRVVEKINAPTVFTYSEDDEKEISRLKSETAKLYAEKDSIEKQKRQLETYKDLYAVTEKYGFDIETFGFDDLGRWAEKNNFEVNLKPKMFFGMPHSPKFDESLSGVIKLTTDEQDRDYELLLYIARQNSNEEFAKNDPWGSSVITMALAPARAAAGWGNTIGDSADVLNGKEIDLFAPERFLNTSTTTIRETVDREYASKLFGGKELPVVGNVGSMLYNTTMSMGDNVVNMAVGAFVGSGLELAGVVNSAVANQITSSLTSALMASDATANTIVSNKKRGLSDEKALSLGIATGLVELATEKFSIDAIIKEPSGFLQAVLKGAIAEGSEEMTSETINLFLDYAVNQDDSEIITLINEYIEAGYSKEQALKKAWGDTISQVIQSGISGTLSGSAMSGTYHSINAINRAQKKSQAIETVNKFVDAVNKESGDKNIAPLPKRASVEDINNKVSEINQRFSGVQSSTTDEILPQAQNDKSAEPTAPFAQGSRGFGVNGQKAFEVNYREDQDAAGYTQDFNQFYRRGFVGQDFKVAESETFSKVLTAEQKKAAYYAGVNDAKISLEQQKNNVQYITSYGKESGVVGNDIAKSYDQELIKAADRLAKAVGAKIEFVETLENGAVNGSIEKGYIQIAKDAYHENMTAENIAAVVIGHEITHRIQETAPVEFSKYRNYVVQNNPKLVNSVASAYVKAGYTITGGAVGGVKFSRKIDGSSQIGYNRKKKSSVYDEYSTNAMIWANSSSTQNGDVTILNDKGKRFVLIESTADGYIELSSGRYEEVYAAYERAYRKTTDELYGNSKSIRANQGSDIWDMQYAEDGGYDDRDGGQTGSQGLQADTAGNNEYLRSGDQGKSVKYSIKETSDTATGKTISWEEILDEAAAEYTGYILNSPETINKFVDDARNGKLVEGGTIEENMGVVKRLWQSIKDFIDKVKKLFKGDKKAQDKAAKDAFGMPMSELEKARDLLLETFRESERIVKGKNNPSQSAELTAPFTQESQDVRNDAEGQRSFDSAQDDRGRVAQDDSGKVAQEDKTIPQSAEPTAPFAQGSHADGDSVHDSGKDARKTVKVKTETITKADIQSKGKKATFGNNGKVDGVVDLDMGKASAETVFKNSGIAKLRSTLPINENAKQIIFMPEVKGETGGVAVYAVNMKQEQDSRGGSMSSMITVPLGENQTADFGLIYDAEFVSESGMYQASDGSENVDTLQIEKSDSKVNPDSVKILLEKIFEKYDKSKSGRKNVLFTFGESDYDTFNMRSVALFEELQRYLPMSIKSQLSYVSQLYRGTAPTNIAVSGVSAENKDISAYKVLDMDNPQRVSGKFSSLVEHIFSLDEGQRQAFLQSLDEQWNGSTAGWSEITPSVSKADSSLKEGAEGKKYSIKSSFYTEYDKWANNGHDGIRTLVVGRTSDVLKSIGIQDKVIKWDTGKIKKILNKHNMNDSIIKQVPDILENPVLIMKSVQKESRITMFGEVYDLDDKPVLAVLELEPINAKGEIIIDEIKIASAYGKDGVQNFINNSEILYVDKNKKRTEDWLTQNRLQLPLGQTNHQFNNTVPQKNGSVNTQYMQNSGKDVSDSAFEEKDNDGKKYSIKMDFTPQEIKAIQNIGDKSVNDFTREDIHKTEKFARKYFEELGTKSPFFRAWFGDWRVNDKNPVIVATKKNNTRGKTINNDTGWEIQVSGKVFAESQHKGTKNQAALPYLDYINSIVENAVLLDSYTSDKVKTENSLMFHSLYAIADIGQGPILLKLYVEEMNNPNAEKTLKRSYQLQNIEKQQLQVRSSGNNPSSIMQTVAVKSVSDLFGLVKQNDKNFNPKPCSLITNKDGTPKVVYHGSGEDFDTFDITKSRSWNGVPDYDLPGFYFAESIEDGQGYGDTKEYYISITNPYKGDVYALAKEKGSFRKAYDYLISEGYDGVIEDEAGEGYYEYIVLKPENIKSATDNIGTFNKDDANTKYSIKMDDVLKQNATLKKAYTQLRAEYAKLQSGKKVADTKRIATVVKNLLDENGFSYNSARLTEQFEGLTTEAQAIFEGKMDFETFSGKVRDVARAVIDEGTRSDSVAYQESKKVRDYLRTTAISLSAEDRANFGDEYETIRKGTFGRLRLVKEGGTPIDVAYQEMSELFPEYFSTETEVGASAQLRQIVSVLDGLQELKTDPFGGYADEAADWLSGMMIDRIFNEVFVSGSTGKVDVSVDMKALRETMGDNLQNIMNRERTWRTKEYDKLQKKFEKKTKTYTESRQKAIKIKQVKLHTERISKALVNPSERFAVPEDLKKPVAEFLQCIDLTSDRMNDKTREQLGDLMKTYKAMAEQEYELNMVIDPDLYNNLETISDSIKELGTKDTRISDLPLATLEKMRNAVMAMEASLRNYNRAFREGKAIQIDALAEKAVAEIKELRKDNKKNSKIWGGASDLMNFDMLNPFDYFHQMGDTFEDLFMGLREGENVQIRDLALAKNNLDKQMEAFEINPNKLSGKKAKAQEFKLANGETVEFTKAQVMSLYLLWRQNASHEHILEGGFRPGEVQQKLIEKKGEDSKVVLKVSEDYSSVRPSLDDVAKILDTLSDNEKKFAESVSDFFVNECAEWGNEVAMKLYGYKKFNTPNYFPIVSDKMYLQEDFGVSADSTIKNTGFTKKRVKHANNPVIIEDIFEVYARHTSDMAKYHGYVLPLQDIQRVFNSSGFAGENNVKALIGSKYGRKAITYFSKLMNDINAGIKNEYGNAFASKMVSQYKKAKMGANVRVVIQQPVSYLRAAALIDPKYLAAASGHKVDLETVFKYSPIAQWKDWGFFSIDTGKSMYDLMTGKKELSDYTMALAGKADQMTWKKLWNAVERETLEVHPELAKGSEDFYKAVGKRFDEVIDRTQVVDSTLHRSQILRSPDTFTKMSVSFMSEPMKTYNLLRSAAVDSIARGDKKGLARTVAVTAVSSIVLACVTGAFDTLTGDDDEEFWKNFTDNLIGDYTGMIPYVKDIASIIQGYDVKRMDMQSFSDVVNAVKMFASDKYTLQYKIANMSMKVADLFGVPASSFKKSVYDTVVKNVFKGIDNQWLNYNMTKQMYPVNGKMKGEFLDILFEAYSAGDKKSYDKIFADMMNEGLKADTIESGLKKRYKDSGMEETFPVPWNNKTEIPKGETVDKFGIEDLDAKQYQKYDSVAVKLETDVVGDIKLLKGEFDDETYNKMLGAAYSYVENVALETSAPDDYDIEAEWIINAMDAAERYGIKPSEYIRYKTEYGLSTTAYEGFADVDASGVDFGEYVVFRDFYWNTYADKDANGKSISGSKKKKVVEKLNTMNLTDEEWDALFFEVAGYKKY